jgi:YgiT-type zinc finger domain-containing protein
MSSKTSSDSLIVCRNCGQRAARQIRRDEIYGRGPQAIIIENVPMIRCDNCGLTYLEPDVIRRIDEICAHPDKYTAQEYRPIAKIA